MTGRTDIIIQSLQMKQLGSVVLKDLSQVIGLLNDRLRSELSFILILDCRQES